MISTIVTFILVLGFLVFIHELGHFMAARKVGVKVLEFSIGFPPRLLSKTVGDTRYILSWIPLGGYVRLLGQDTEDENPEEEGNYASKKLYQRFFILVAGSAMNILVALALMPMVYLIGYEVPAYLETPSVVFDVEKDSAADLAGIQKGDRIIEVEGKPTQTWQDVRELVQDNIDSDVEVVVLRNGNELRGRLDFEHVFEKKTIGWKPVIEPVVGKVFPKSAAEAAGIRTGDKILSVGGEKIEDWNQLSTMIQKSEGKMLEFYLMRNNTVQTVSFVPKWNEQNSYWVIGVQSASTHRSDGFVEAVQKGGQKVFDLTARSYRFLYQLIVGEQSVKQVGGPIMIASMVGQAAESGVSNLMALVAFISLQLGIFNLLPIPALDGGHILLLLFEKIKGKALSKNFRQWVQRTGFSLLMILILYISIQDGFRLFN